MVPIRRILQNVPVELVAGDINTEIAGVEHHSGRIEPNMLFVLTLDDSQSARRYLLEAIERGAKGVVVKPSIIPFLQHISYNCVVLVTQEPRKSLGLLLKNWYNAPDEKLFVVGVTGTNGKTTTTWFLQQLLAALNVPAAIIGTLGMVEDRKISETGYTTPEPVLLWKLLHRSAISGYRAVAIEVTSHALDQGRVEGVSFDAAVFTNLSRDHLDYHRTMEAYFEAKARLFTSLNSSALAVLNGEDPYGRRLQAYTKARVLYYGREEGLDISIRDWCVEDEGAIVICEILGSTVTFRFPYPAQFLLFNALAAIGTLIGSGYPIEQILPHISSLRLPPGRMQRIDMPTGVSVYIDYAHTPDALRCVLRQLKEIVQNTNTRLFCLFGCGGERDVGKRAEMGKIAAALADQVILTTDNPRNEDPLRIVQDILQGIPKEEHHKIRIELDRKKAIFETLQSAGERDVVLIAGKGHEQFQIIGSRRIPFSDASIVEEWIRQSGVSDNTDVASSAEDLFSECS